MQEISSGTTEHQQTAAMPDSAPLHQVCPASPWSIGWFLDLALTDVDGLWEPLPNPLAGLEEQRWLRQNLHRLANYQGLWIAILGRSIAASGDSFQDVHQQLVARNIADALVVKVPDDLTRQDYLIA